MLKMNIILRRTLAKQEPAERTPKRREIKSICSSDLLTKHELINWMSMDLIVLRHWFCKIIFISFETSTGKISVVCWSHKYAHLYKKSLSILWKDTVFLTQIWHGVIKENYCSSPDSLSLKILWAAYYLSLFQYECCSKWIWNISVWNIRQVIPH